MRTFECIDSHRRNQDFVLEGVYLPAAWGKFSLEIFRYNIVKTYRFFGRGRGFEPLKPKGGCATDDVTICDVSGFKAANMMTRDSTFATIGRSLTER